VILLQRTDLKKILLNSRLSFLKNVYFINKTLKLYRKFKKGASLIFTGEENEDCARKVLDTARIYIKNTSEPHFLWIHLMDVHFPYRLPYTKNPFRLMYYLKERQKWNSYGNGIDEVTLSMLRKMYNVSVEYVDLEISRFIEFVLNLYGNEATIFITSDHGEEFMERNHLNHFDNPYIEIAKVPLLLIDFKYPAKAN